MARGSDSSAPDGISSKGDARVGVVLADRYRIDALLDRGAMGRVYSGEHVLMKKRVAIKVLHRELTMVPEFVARFEREAMAAANIDSEHVVAATDFGKLPDGAVFLVLEFVVGRNLRDEVSQGPMRLPRALHLVRQIANALKSAHSLGIIHRDLKPENIMLVDRAGDPDFIKVLDFGIAKVPIGEATDEDSPDSRQITKAGMVFGTPEYMPPEQALGQSVDARADLYSLGVIFYEMLAGCRPFVAKSQVGVLGQQISLPVPPIRSRAPGVLVPPVIEKLVMRMLEREPGNRLQTAQEVLDAIDQHLGYAPRERIPTLRDGSIVDAGPPEPAPPGYGGGDAPANERISIPGESKPMVRLSAFVDKHRNRLPAVMRTLPAPVLLSVPMAAVGLLLGFGAVAAFSGQPAAPVATAAEPPASAVRVDAITSAPAPAPTAAPPEDLSAATQSGVTALEALSKRYPKDPAIALAIANVALKAKDLPRAVSAVEAALALDPKLANDAQIATALWITAQNKKTSAAAFELLRGPMGERGNSILHDLATTDGVRDAIKAEAQKSVGVAAAKRP
jgi:serine/threonine-protein kinase